MCNIVTAEFKGLTIYIIVTGEFKGLTMCIIETGEFEEITICYMVYHCDRRVQRVNNVHH